MHDEYVIFDPNQQALRYLIEISLKDEEEEITSPSSSIVNFVENYIPVSEGIAILHHSSESQRIFNRQRKLLDL